MSNTEEYTKQETQDLRDEIKNQVIIDGVPIYVGGDSQEQEVRKQKQTKLELKIPDEIENVP